MKHIVISHLEVDITQSCNLQCLGCHHYSNLGLPETHSDETRLEWISNMASICNRLNVSTTRIKIVGGEPTLNNRLSEYIEAMSQIPHKEFVLASNGTNVIKNVSALKAFDVRLDLSHHSNSNMRYTSRFSKVVEAMKRAGVTYSINRAENWVSMYKYCDGRIYPYNSQNIEASWKSCEARNCTQLFDNKLWKCPPITFLRAALQKTGQLTDLEWKNYLHYRPLDLTDVSRDKMIAFFQRRDLPESVCAMCPSNATGIKNKPIYRKDYELVYE